MWRWNEAERSYQRALQLAPNDPRGWQACGEHRLLHGDTAGAVAGLDRAAHRDSATPIVHSSLGAGLAPDPHSALGLASQMARRTARPLLRSG